MLDGPSDSESSYAGLALVPRLPPRIWQRRLRAFDPGLVMLCCSGCPQTVGHLDCLSAFRGCELHSGPLQDCHADNLGPLRRCGARPGCPKNVDIVQKQGHDGNSRNVFPSCYALLLPALRRHCGGGLHLRRLRTTLRITRGTTRNAVAISCTVSLLIFDLVTLRRFGKRFPSVFRLGGHNHNWAVCPTSTTCQRQGW